MRTLIAEDDFTSRNFLYKFLSRYGECDITIDGLETIEVFLMSLEEEKYYDLLCLDIMMPKVNGLEVLKTIRNLEKNHNIPKDKRIKIIMTTALNNSETVLDSYEKGSEAYAVKPIDVEKFIEVLKNLELID